jgi:cyclic pyranopterin phosphate synthase
MPKRMEPLTHHDILRYEEILRVCKAAIKSGIKNFKVTGGEPLLHKSCVPFLRSLKALEGATHVTLTTNGVLLEPYINELSAMGLDGLNISLDSVCPDTYKKITGRDSMSLVLRSLKKAVKAGLRVKINFVPMRGVNDGEIINVSQFAVNLPVDVRFIEFMPTKAGEPFERVDGNVILAILREAYPDLREDATRRGFGPARYYKNGAMLGSVGIISAIGDNFCDNCNRVRLTSGGFLKLCLFHDDGLDLKPLLRGGAGDDNIGAAFHQAVLDKPENYTITSRFPASIKNMSRIGG